MLGQGIFTCSCLTHMEIGDLQLLMSDIIRDAPTPTTMTGTELQIHHLQTFFMHGNNGNNHIDGDNDWIIHHSNWNQMQHRSWETGIREMTITHGYQCHQYEQHLQETVPIINPVYPIQEPCDEPRLSSFPATLVTHPKHESCHTSSVKAVHFDPPYHLKAHPQHHLYPEAHKTLPQLCGLPSASTTGHFFGMLAEEDGSGCVYRHDTDAREQFDIKVSDIIANVSGKKLEIKSIKHSIIERQKRLQENENYKVLRRMVPNPTKPDKASVLDDAIGYIKDLIGTVKKLQTLVEKRNFIRQKNKKPKTDDYYSSAENLNMCVLKPHEEPVPLYFRPLLTFCCQKKSRDVEFDIQIVEDDVIIKLVQRKTVGCLLLVSRIVDDLQLDLHHMAGGLIGDHYSFLVNAKICEGSSICPDAIVNTLMEVYIGSEGSSV